MAYRLKKTFKVSLSSSDGEAVFEFKRPPLNRLFEATNVTEFSVEKLKKDWLTIAEDIVTIEGFEHEDGTPVNKEEIVNFELDLLTMKSLVIAYNAAIAGFISTDIEKKESTSA